VLSPGTGASAQVALTLRLLGGLETSYIARAFLVPEATMAKRLVAPSRRSASARSRTACRATPSSRTGCARCSPVIYLVFNEGYVASEGGALIRDDLCAEAIRLRCLLAELMPD
jgi:RNA polymerase sigma-70 factor (ECF subfamily)